MSNQIFISLVTTFRTTFRLSRNIFTHRLVYGTHYDTLKLSRNCTNKDVRDSFIKLSKQFHPDKNQNDSNTHAQFVKVNEAYHVLSRPDSRRAYDLTLQPERHFNPRHGQTPFDVYTTAYRQRVVWRDESFWEFQDKTKYGSRDSSDFYGIKGVRRVPNAWIAILCIVFSVVGLWIQVILIRQSTAFHRHRLDERSEEAGKVLADVQEQALIHGNKVQLDRMKQRFNQTEMTPDALEDKSGTPPLQETANNAEKNLHPYNIGGPGGPSVIVISDTEFQNLSEGKYLDRKSMISWQTIDELEYIAAGGVPNTDLMKSSYTRSVHNGTTSSDTSRQEFISIRPGYPVKKPPFEMIVGNEHDIKITNEQSQPFYEKPQDFQEPCLHPEVIVMTEPGEVFCEMHVVNRLR